MSAKLLVNWLKKLLPSGAQRLPRGRSSNRGVPLWRPLFEILEDRLTPNTYTVTNLNDSAGSASNITLRYAVNHAQNGDTIHFGSSVNGGTLTLGSTLTITTNIAITGPGPANLTLSGGSSVQPIVVNAGVTASISGLSIVNGLTLSGGGIANAGTLALSNDTIADNSADTGGGIFNMGTLTVSDCTLSNNTATGGGPFLSGSGGGLFNDGTLTLSNSTIADNTAKYGGGLANYSATGLATVTGCTFTGNVAVLGSGSGINNFAGKAITLSNSTMVDNTGGLAAVYNSGTTFALTNDTIAFNSPDGVGNSTIMNNTIVSGNTSANVGGIYTGSHNLIGTVPGLASALANNGGPTQTLALSPGSPAIGAGGAITCVTTGESIGVSDTTIHVQNAATIAQTPGNYPILIDQEEMLVTNVNTTTNTLTVERGVNGTTAATHAAGANVELATDQRGVSTPLPPDIGSYQTVVAPTVTPNTANLPENATSMLIGGSNFSTAAANDSVTFDQGVTATVLFASVTALDVSLTGLSSVAAGTALHATVTVSGSPSVAPVQVATVGSSRLLPSVTSGTNSVADNSTALTITGTHFDTTAANNSVFFTSLGVVGTVTAVNAAGTQLTVTVTTPPTGLGALNAVVATDGAASGAPVQAATEVSGNWVVTDSTNGTGSVADVTLPFAVASSQNGDTIAFASSLRGAAITLSSTLTIDHNVAITGPGAANLTVSGGGAVQVVHVGPTATASISGLTLENGSATSGGGIYNAGTLTVSNDTLNGNTAANGGGIFNNGTLTANDDALSGNIAGSGGGIFNAGTLAVSNSTLSNNTVSGGGYLGYASGGGIFNDGTLTLSNSTVANNSAVYSGGLENSENGLATITGCTFTGNHGGSGAGINNFAGAAIALSNSTVAYNTGTGAGVANTTGGTITLSNDTIAFNGGVGVKDPTTMNNTIVAGNSAAGMNVIGTYAGGNNLVGDSTSLAPALANHGGGTQTLTLVPGSAAIGTGGALTSITPGDPAGASDTTIYVQNAAAIALTPGNFYILIDQEEMLVTNVNTTTNTLTVQRGVNGTTAAAHAAGASVYLATDQRGILRPTPPDIGAFQLQTVTPSTANLPSLSTSLTIGGSAFDPITANDSVTIDNGVTGIVTGATSTSLTVSLTGLVSVPAGTALHASVTVDGVSGGSPVQVATVTAPSPTVTLTTTNLPDTSTTVTIQGTNFDPTAANNTVSFNLGVLGTVTSATATQLTVTLSAPPTTLGSLTALVTSDGFASAAPVPVATEVNGTWLVTDSGSGAGSPSVVTLPYAVAHALSGDTIAFANNLSGAIISPSSTLNLDSNVAIAGLGAANLAVSGSHAILVFNVPTGVTASIWGLTIEDGANGHAGYGNSGGGIANAGTLSLSNDAFTGNTAGNSGGGIYNNGTLTVNDSTFTNNTAPYGAGIDNTSHNGSAGVATVNRCTFTGNTATVTPGSGSGINNWDGNSLTLSNSTLLGNLGGSAAVFNGGNTLTLISDTIAFNDNGVNGATSIDNTIVAGNTVANVTGSYTGDYNLIGNATDLSTTLANNGGATPTLALLTGSAALGGGDPSQAGTSSQNDVIRPATPDLGAYQTPNPPPTVTGLSPNTGSAAGGTVVTITGTYFLGATAVDFGPGQAATNVTVNATGTQITATDPSGTGTVDVTVVTGNGTSATSAADQFTYAAVSSTFQVSSTTLLSGDNGFLVTFNAPYNVAQLSLYTGDSGHTLTTRSVQIALGGTTIFGGTGADSVGFNAVPVNSTQLELIETGLTHVAAAPVLQPGNYTVTLDGGSGDPAFLRLSDYAFLDGNGDGTLTTVDNYTSPTLTVPAIPATTDMVTIGDLAAGPGQTLPVPLVLSGGTGSVSQTTAVNLSIVAPADGAYTVVGFTLNSVLTGITVSFTPATGVLTLTSATAFSTSDNPLLLGTFTVAVAGLGNSGTASAIDTKTPINITVTSVLKGTTPIPFVGVNGFHVSAYPGNLAAPIGTYNSSDLSQLQALIIGSVRAFALYPNVDPLLLADVNDDGTVNSTDVSQLQARVLGAASSIPALPAGASGVAINGADPVLFVGSTFTPNGQPANLGSLTPGSTVLVPLSVFATDPHGVNVTSTEAAFSFDPRVFALNGVSAGAIANGSLGGYPFAIAFAEVGPGEVNVIGSSSFGPNLAYGQTATLFLVSLTVRVDAPAGSTLFNLMSSEGSFLTGLQDNLGRNLVLAPAPVNRAGDNLDGVFTVQSGKPVQQSAGVQVGAATLGVKQAGSVTALSPGGWEQLTTLLFGDTTNQCVVNANYCGLAVAALPGTVVAEGKKQTDSMTTLQLLSWEQLTTRLFGDGIQMAVMAQADGGYDNEVITRP